MDEDNERIAERLAVALERKLASLPPEERLKLLKAINDALEKSAEMFERSN